MQQSAGDILWIYQCRLGVAVIGAHYIADNLSIRYSKEVGILGDGAAHRHELEVSSN